MIACEHCHKISIQVYHTHLPRGWIEKGDHYPMKLRRIPFDLETGYFCSEACLKAHGFSYWRGGFRIGKNAATEYREPVVQIFIRGDVNPDDIEVVLTMEHLPLQGNLSGGIFRIGEPRWLTFGDVPDEIFVPVAKKE